MREDARRCAKMRKDAQRCTVVLMIRTSAASSQMAHTAVNREVVRAARRMHLNQYDNTPLRQGGGLAVSAVNAINSSSPSASHVYCYLTAGAASLASKVTFVCDSAARSRLVVYRYGDRPPPLDNHR